MCAVGDLAQQHIQWHSSPHGQVRVVRQYELYDHLRLRASKMDISLTIPQLKL